MILANVRSQMGRGDAQLAVRLVARGSGKAQDEAEAKLADEGMDPLLDDPRLIEGLLTSRQAAHASLPMFCYVTVRHALKAAGANERMLADYVASILLHFGLRQRATRLKEHDDESYTTLAEIGEAIESGDQTRSFLARAHLGNYALWISGLFPDHIEYRRWRRGGPHLGYYETMGAKGFRLAATHQLANEHGMASLYDVAADHFSRIRCALNTLSDRLLFPHVHSPERLMRQVRDEMRWKH
jgi:hypothetical protein